MDAVASDPMADEPTAAPEEPAAKPAKDRGEMVYGLVVGLLYVAGVAVQVFIVVDELTDGRLSDDLAAWWRRVSAQARERRRVNEMFTAQKPWVLWDAHQIILDVEGTET